MDYIPLASLCVTVAGGSAGAAYLLLSMRYNQIIEQLNGEKRNFSERALDYHHRLQLAERETKNLVAENEGLRTKNSPDGNNYFHELSAHLNDPDFDLWTFGRGDIAAKLANATPQIPIVSLINFKGGVGKTTLTSSLACYLSARHGARVLMVDLDYQGSLTNLCRRAWIGEEGRIPLNGFSKLLPGSWLHSETSAKNLIDGSFDLSVLLKNSILMETDYRFLSIENRSYLRWVVDPNYPDLRLRLREILSPQVVTDRFDIVLIDCPPRLSLGAINALFASSHYLVPSIFDTLSAEPIEFLLTQLGSLFKDFPGPKCLGVVGIRTATHTNWQGEELRVKENIDGVLSEASIKPGVFPHSLPNRAAFVRNAGQAFAYQVEKAVPAWVDPIGDEFIRRIGGIRRKNIVAMSVAAE